MIVVPQLAFHSALVAAGEELPPVRAVRELAQAGAEQIQLLDLDGTVASDVLPQWVEALVAMAVVPVRLDTRLRDAQRLERLVRCPFGTVVLGQWALGDAALVRWALDLLGSRLCLELQVDGEYLFDAPPSAFGTEVVDVLGMLHVQGVRRVLYRDVTGQELPLQRLLEIGDRVPGVQLTYQGAVRTPSDVGELRMVGRVLEAVVVDGAEVLAGRFDLLAAQREAAPGS